MGTNFYLRKKLSKEQKDTLHKYIEEQNWEKLKDNIPQDIHIGKRSGGWKFLWNANRFKYFKPNKDSIVEFLKSGIIIDEYGNEFTYLRFMLSELDGFIDKGLDAEAYHKKKHREIPVYFTNGNNLEGIEANQYGEFYIDNLRFTTCDEFC